MGSCKGGTKRTRSPQIHNGSYPQPLLYQFVSLLLVWTEVIWVFVVFTRFLGVADILLLLVLMVVSLVVLVLLFVLVVILVIVLGYS